MKNRVFITLSMFAIVSSGLLLSSCKTPTVPVSMIIPGEINLKGVSKIAIMDFNTVDDNKELGIYAADSETVKMLQNSIASTIYEHPFYSIVDLDVEKLIKDSKEGVKPKHRFDAIMYGKVWWMEGAEYHNDAIKKVQLEKWHVEKYTQPGGGKQVEVKLTDEINEELMKYPYRSKNASLMMSISLYKVNSNGRLEKITETFDVAGKCYLIDNGVYNQTHVVVDERKQFNKFDALKSNALSAAGKTDASCPAPVGEETSASTEPAKGGGLGSFMDKMVTPVSNIASDLPGSSEKGKDKAVDSGKKPGSGVDFEASTAMNTIPPADEAKSFLIDVLSRKFNKRIAPHKETLELMLAANDDLLSELMKKTAYVSAVKYIVENKFSGNNTAFYEPFYNADFDEGFKMVMAEETKEKGYSPEKIKSCAIDRTGANVDYIYNYAVCEEALGHYEKALAIYRRILDVNNKNLAYADGIARCLFALDMADKVTEGAKNKNESQNKGKF